MQYVTYSCTILLSLRLPFIIFCKKWKIVALNDLDLEGLKPVASHTSDIRNYFCYDDKHKKFLYICFYLVPSN